MPKLSFTRPKYRRFSPRNVAFVVLRGRRVYLPGKYNSEESKREYLRLVGEWETQGRPAESAPSAKAICVRHVLAKFWTWAEGYYTKNGRSTGTADNYKPLLGLLRTRYSDVPCVEFGPLAVKSLMREMESQGLGRRSINDNLHRIKKIFKWATSEELIPPEIHQALATVAGLQKGRSKARESVPVMPVAKATVDATLPHMPAVVADMVRLQRFTGMRPGEVCQLRPIDVDRSGDVWKYIPEEHKTEHHGKQRVICIGPQGQAVLAKYLLREAGKYCFSPRDSERKRLETNHAARKTPMSCGNVPGSNRDGTRQKALGDRYTNDSYRLAIHRACEVAFGMPEALRVPLKLVPEGQQREFVRKGASEWRDKNCWSPNQLRHSTATEIRHRYGLEAAQVTLGHSRADVTQIYAEKNLDLAIKVAFEVG